MQAPDQMNTVLEKQPLRIGAYIPNDLLEDWFASGSGMNSPPSGRWRLLKPTVASSNASSNITPSAWKECFGNGYRRYE